MSVTIAPTNAFSNDAPYLNVSNRNFATLWNALGLDVGDWVGEIDPLDVMCALRRFDPSLVVRETIEDGCMISCGITPEQVERYRSILTAVCNVAFANGSTITFC